MTWVYFSVNRTQVFEIFNQVSKMVSLAETKAGERYMLDNWFLKTYNMKTCKFYPNRICKEAQVNYVLFGKPIKEQSIIFISLYHNYINNYISSNPNLQYLKAILQTIVNIRTSSNYKTSFQQTSTLGSIPFWHSSIRAKLNISVQNWSSGFSHNAWNTAKLYLWWSLKYNVMPKFQIYQLPTTPLH